MYTKKKRVSSAFEKEFEKILEISSKSQSKQK